MGGHIRLVPRSVRSRLLMLLIVALAPMLLVQGGIFWSWFQTRLLHEKEANLNLARAVSGSLEAFVSDVLRQEQTIGTALFALQPYRDDQAVTLLAASARAYPAVRDFSWVSPDGVVLASSLPGAASASIRGRTYYHAIAGGSEVAVSDLIISQTTRRPIFTICRGIRDEAGVLRGIVVAAVQPERLPGTVLDGVRGNDAACVVTDARGTVVCSTGPQQFITPQDVARFRRLIASAETGKGRADTVRAPDGRLRVLAVAPVPGTARWAVGMSSPESEVLDPILGEMRQSIGWLSAIAVCSLLVALALSRSVTQPLRALRSHAQALGWGDLDARVEVKGPRELEELAAAFDHMAEEVRARERTVQEEQQQVSRLAATLQQERDVLNAVMENTRTHLAYLDPDLNFVMANSTYARGSGHTIEELIGRNHFALFPDEENERIFRQVLDTGEAVEFHAKPFDFPDQPWRGTTYWDWVLVPVNGESGSVQGLVFSLVDVTERMRAQQERERYLERLQLLIRVAADVLAERDVTGLLQRIADAACELTNAHIAVSGHGFRGGTFQVGARSQMTGVPPCPPGEVFEISQGGVYLGLIEDRVSLRLTQEELLRHPRWRGLPEGHMAVRGLLGARLVGHHNLPNGLIMVSDKEEGDFTAEDEVLLVQLAALASLGLQHIEARGEAERRADELDAVFAALFDMVIIYNAQGEPVQANPAPLANYGIDPTSTSVDDLARRLDLRHPDGRPVLPADFPSTRALQGEPVVGERFLLQTADGRELVAHVSASPLRTGEAIVGAVVVWHDATEQESLLQQLQQANERLTSQAGVLQAHNDLLGRMTDALEQERARLEAVLQQMPAGVVIADAPSGRITLENRQMADIWRRPFHPAMDDQEGTGFRPDGRRYSLGDWPLARALTTGEVVRDEEATIVRGDGTRGVVLMNSAPIRDRDGRIIGGVVIDVDITERKQAEEALERERAFLSSAIDLLPLPISFVGPDMSTLRRNRTMVEFLLGCDVPDGNALRLLDRRTHAPLAREEWAVTRALNGEAVSFAEVLAGLPDGREIPMIVHAAPVYVGGEIAAAVLAFQDISPLKEADRAKDEFLAVLSHELLTPITSILGWSQVALEQPEPTIMHRALTVVERNVRRQKRLVDDLLDVSRIIHGKLHISCEHTDLWQLAEQCVESAQQLAEMRGVRVTVEPPDGALPIYADPARVMQAISNLVNNALKFTEAGGAITIAGGTRDGHAVLTVGDTGRGIAPESLGSVFDPFRQVKRDEAVGGLGLGLALVKGIMELHDGRATAYSAGEGRGSTFTIELPLAE